VPTPNNDLTKDDVPLDETEIKRVASLPIRNTIGKLWWVALQTRPDRFTALHKCALWQNKPSEKLWKHLMSIIILLQ
jgi:hypothetical protein